MTKNVSKTHTPMNTFTIYNKIKWSPILTFDNVKILFKKNKIVIKFNLRIPDCLHLFYLNKHYKYTEYIGQKFNSNHLLNKKLIF